MYSLGVAAALLAFATPFSMPCIFKLVTGLPCSGCGLTRSVVLAMQLDFVGAITMNILFLPLAIGAMAYFSGALLDLFAGKHTIDWLNAFLAKKLILAIIVMLAAVSWGYNIIRGL